MAQGLDQHAQRHPPPHRARFRPRSRTIPEPSFVAPKAIGPCPGVKNRRSELSEHASVCMPQLTFLNLNVNRRIIKQKA